MLTKEKINRINELSKLSKRQELNAEDTLERSLLRSEYLSKFRENFKDHLDRIKFVEDIEEEQKK